MEKLNDIPFFKGMHAAAYGKALNPYSPGSKEATQWMEGYKGIKDCAQEIEENETHKR